MRNVRTENVSFILSLFFFVDCTYIVLSSARNAERRTTTFAQIKMNHVLVQFECIIAIDKLCGSPAQFVFIIAIVYGYLNNLIASLVCCTRMRVSPRRKQNDEKLNKQTAFLFFVFAMSKIQFLITYYRVFVRAINMSDGRSRTALSMFFFYLYLLLYTEQ